MRTLCVLLGSALAAACGQDAAVGALPLADAGFDVRVKVGSSVLLDGRGSRDPDDQGLLFEWRIVGTPEDSEAELVGITTERPTLEPDIEGTYLVELVVSNTERESLPDIVAVVASNNAPTAVAECVVDGCEVLHGGTARLRGQSSFDPDGDSLSYSWDQVTDPSGCGQCADLDPCDPASQTASIAIPNAEDTDFTAPDAKDLQLVFALTVSDGVSSDTGCAAYTTTNTPPINQFGRATPSAVDEGDTFELNALTGDSDPGDDASLTHLWEQIGGGPAADISDPTVENPTVTAPSVSADTELEFQLTVSDGIDETVGEPVFVTVRNL